MSRVSQDYLGLSRTQQQLFGDLVSQGVRCILRQGPAIDAAMRAALERHAQTRGSMPPRLKLVIDIEVVEFSPDAPAGFPLLIVGGGES
jgi:hypothetical protein